MPRAEVGTPKYLANKMKSKGLQRLRWYCQVCEKQCRDENGFKCHAQSESHLRQMLVVGENAGRHIADFSSQFQYEFVQLLSRRFGTKRVKANTVYQEFIQDKQHLHMNATRWVTLTEFVKHLGRTGVARVDETEKGWFLAWIDNSPKALARQEASLKKERLTTSDEQRERQLIAEQIERAKAEEGGEETTAPTAEEFELKRDDGAEKVVLSFSMKPATAPAATPTPSSSAPTTAIGGLGGLKLNPLKQATNPLKRPNVFKAAATTSVAKDKDSDSNPSRKRELSAAEKLMQEDQERKRRRLERESQAA
jgi:DNA/RNA-binding protein KIN17